MRWNPILSGVAASVYIALVVLLLQFVSSIRSNMPDTPLDPIAALSLLVFSAAVMGFIFFYQPAVLLIENKKTEALASFFKTLGTFAIVSILLLIVLSALGLA